MTTPIEVWHDILIFAVLCTVYLVFGNDTRNYTDSIAGILATVLYFISGLIVLSGIQPQTGDAWSSPWLMWLLFAMCAIVAIMTIISIIDVLHSRDSHVGNFSNNGMDLNDVGR